MADIKRKIVSLLVAEEVSGSEFRAVAAWLRSGGLEECVETAERIRDLLQSGSTGKAVVAVRVPRNAIPANPPTGDVAGQVHRLLVAEAGLGAPEALALLARQLKYSGPLPKKKAFKFIVERLVSELGGSRVLTAAHQIRNQRVHSGLDSDWVLSRVETDN
jgi:hypothetical protein